MIKEAIERILSLATPHNVDVRGRRYTDKQLYPLKDPLPAPIHVNTLTGLVDYVKLHGSGDLDGEKFFIHVQDYNSVELVSFLDGEWQQRTIFVRATPVDFCGFPFERFQVLEDFIIKLQALFVSDEQSLTLLKMVSNIKDEILKISSDDGVSQVVTVKKGPALVAEQQVPNPVTLRPFRTFQDIEQPPSPFIFRLKTQQGSEFIAALFEADGGKWRLTAIQAIKEFLEGNLEGVSIIA